MASTLVFSASEDEILIQEVQKNSVLFNIGDKNYKNIILKDNIWKDISLKLGKSGNAVYIRHIIYKVYYENNNN